MIKSKYNWDITQPDTFISESSSDQFKLSPIVKKVLESKNIVDNQEIQNLFKDTNISHDYICLLYTSPSPRDKRQSRMPSSA